MLDQPFMTDLIEANAMGHMPNLIDIYSASWGPTDDGKTVDGPRNLTMRAIVNGVNNVSSAAGLYSDLAFEKPTHNHKTRGIVWQEIDLLCSKDGQRLI